LSLSSALRKIALFFTFSKASNLLIKIIVEVKRTVRTVEEENLLFLEE